MPVWRWDESPTESNQRIGYIAFAQWMRSILINFKALVPSCVWVQTLTLISVWWLRWRKRFHKLTAKNASSYHQLIFFLWRSALMPTVNDSSLHHCWHKLLRTVWPLRFSLLSVWDMKYIKMENSHFLIATSQLQDLVQSQAWVTVCAASPVLPIIAWLSSGILPLPQNYVWMSVWMCMHATQWTAASHTVFLR